MVGDSEAKAAGARRAEVQAWLRPGCRCDRGSERTGPSPPHAPRPAPAAPGVRGGPPFSPALPRAVQIFLQLPPKVPRRRPARQVRAARRALSSPGSRTCKCGPAPGAAVAAAAGTSALVRRLAAPRAGLDRSRPAFGAPAPSTPRSRPLAHSQGPLPTPLPSPQAVPRAGPQRRSYLPRGLSISVPFHPHDPELRQEESCSVIVFTAAFPSSGVLRAP